MFDVRIHTPEAIRRPDIHEFDNVWIAIVHAFEMSLQDGIWYTEVIIRESRLIVAVFNMKLITASGMEMIPQCPSDTTIREKAADAADSSD